MIVLPFRPTSGLHLGFHLGQDRHPKNIEGLYVPRLNLVFDWFKSFVHVS